MKNKLLVFLLVAFIMITTTVFSQNSLSALNGYKLIFLPYELSNITGHIHDKFYDLGFKVLTDEATLKGNIDYKKDPSLTLICQIEHSYDYPHTTIGIKLVNAKTEVLFQGNEDTRGKTFVSFDVNKDQRWVIDKIFEQFRSFKYSFDLSQSLSVIEIKNLPRLELTGWTEESIKSHLTSSKPDPIEGIYKSYQTEGMPYYKIGVIKNGDIFKAVIIESDLAYWKKGELKATFEQSSMKGLYSAKWYMGDKTPFETFASMDDNVILAIEFKDSQTGEKRQDKFIKMFPPPNGNTVLKKDNSKSSGSGFFISTGGIIATNAHVVEGASMIEVTVSNEIGSFTYKAKILLVDNKNDVALLQINDEKFKGLMGIPYKIIETADVGSKVFTIGYPLNNVMGSNYKVTDGIVSAKSGIEDDLRYYQISVPLQPGNSGGPLFNKDGNVIGITSARLNGQSIGTQVQNVNYAIKSDYLLNLYKMLPNPEKLSSNSLFVNKELQDQVKVLKNYVCLIKVSYQ